MEPVHLTAADCVFVMIDIQEKLVPALSGGEKAVFEASRLLRCAQEMKIPLLTTEQYPKGLGPTVGPLRPFIDENALFAKTSFSCFEANGFAEKLSAQKQEGLKAYKYSMGIDEEADEPFKIPAGGLLNGQIENQQALNVSQVEDPMMENVQ